MKFLDEDIILTFNNINVSASGTYQYVIKEDNTVIFNGNMFLASGQTTASIEVNDIIANRKYVPKITSFVATYSEKVNNANTYSAELTVGDSTYTSNTEVVFLIYRYPNYKSEMSDNIAFNYITQQSWYKIMLQGAGRNKDGWTIPYFVPHIPYKDTEEYGLVVQGLYSSNTPIWNFQFYVKGAIAPDYNYQFSPQIPITQNVISCGTLFGGSEEPKKLYPDETCYVGTTEIPKQADGSFKISIPPNGTYTYTITTNGEETETIKTGTTPIIGKQYIDFYFNGTVYGVTQLNITINDIIHNIQINISDSENFDKYSVIHGRCYFEKTIGYLGSYLIYKTEYFENGTVDDTDNKILLATVGNFYKGLGDLVAYVDKCPARYYLMWQDRFGDFQSQPFEKTETYSEGFERTNYTTYKKEKRLTSIGVQPKWKINTGFLDENLYPYYESIFVSPYLLLYDTVEDKSYRVTVEDSNYTEKTVKNQGRKLFNLELEVSQDKKQQILY